MDENTGFLGVFTGFAGSYTMLNRLITSDLNALLTGISTFAIRSVLSRMLSILLIFTIYDR
jgi:hypothetical protein